MSLADFREKYPQYDDLSDFQLARGLHAKYQHDTGVEVTFEEFSNGIGVSVKTQDLPIPSQGGEPSIISNTQPIEEHASLPVDQPPNTGFEQGDPTLVADLRENVIEQPPAPGLGQETFTPSMVERVQAKVNTPIVRDTFVEAVTKAARNVPEHFRMAFAGMRQYQAEHSLPLVPEDWEPKTKAGRELKANEIKARKEAAEQAKQDYEAAKADLEPINVEPQSPAYYGSAVVSSLSQFAPALFAGILTRNPGVTLNALGVQTKGQAYGEGRDKGLSKDDADIYSTATAAAETIPELLPVSIILKPGQKLFSRVFKGAMAEVLQEEITEALQIGIDKKYIDPDMTWAEARQRLIDAGVVAGIAGPTQSAIAHPLVQGMERVAGPQAQLGRQLNKDIEEAQPIKTADEVARQELQVDDGVTYPRIQHEETQTLPEGEFVPHGTESTVAGLEEQQIEEPVNIEQGEVEAIKTLLQNGEIENAKVLAQESGKANEFPGLVKAEIDTISDAVTSRRQEWISQNTGGEYYPQDMDFLTTQEREKLHQLKLALPSQGQEVADAKTRIQERINSRPKRHNKPITYTDFGESAKELTAKSYLEYKGYRIAKRHDKQYDVIDETGKNTNQFAGINGAVNHIDSIAEEEATMPQDGAVASRNPGPDKIVINLGENYAGGIEGEGVAGDENTPRRKKVTRREDVLIPFMKALNIPIYQGRIKDREGAAGYYFPRREAVRLKRHSDIETAAHEIAHHVDDILWRPDSGSHRGSHPWLTGPNAREYAAELKTVSYDKAKVYEGFAEFVRHWMTNPEHAKRAAPKFHEYWENLVETHGKLGKALKRAREDMLDWVGQSPVDRGRSKIGETKDINAEALDSFWNNARQSVLDDLHGALKAETQITGEKAAIEDGPYERMRLARAAHSIVDGVMQYGPLRRVKSNRFDFVDRDGNTSVIYQTDSKGRVRVKNNPSFKKWGLKEVLKPVSHQLDDWTLYAVGRSASELMSQGREKLFTQEEIKGFLKLGEGKPEFAKAFDDYQAWNRSIVDFAIQMGLISKEDRARWQRQQYIPFYRVGTRGPAKKLKGIEGNVKATYMLTGGTQNLNNIIDNMVQNASRLITESIKNDARRKMVDFLEINRGGGRFLMPISKDSKKVGIDSQQVRDKFLESLGINPAQYRRASKLGQGNPTLDELLDVMEAQMGDYANFWIHGQAPKGENIIAVMRNGKPQFYEVADPLLMRSFASLNPESKGLIRGTLNTFRRFGQTTITLTLDFMAANIWRDTLHGWVFSRHGFKPVVDSIRGMKSRIAHDPAYRAFIANGGGMASYYIDEGAMEKHLKRFYDRKGVHFDTVMTGPRKLLWGMEVLADAFEMSTRLGEFKKSVRKGSSTRHAAYSGREVSTDFAMRGDSEALGWAYDSILFLKAGMNGLDRVYRGLTKDPNRAAVYTKAGAIATISVALYLLNRGNPDYDDLEDWDKDTHWHVFVPRSDGTQLHLRFPKIWEIGAMASAAERTMGLYLDSVEKKHGDLGLEYSKRLGHVFFDLFKFDYIPFAIEPLVEVYGLNRNRFTGREIETGAMQGREPFARYSPYTNKTLMALAEQTSDLPPDLQMSPARLEALVMGYLNTWGMYGLMLADETLYGEKLPDRKLSEYPVLRRFTKSHPLRRTWQETKFWKMYDEASQLNNTANFMIDQERPEIAERKLGADLTPYFDLLSAVKSDIGELNKEIQLIYGADMSGAEKRREIDKLQNEKNNLFKDLQDSLAEQD